MSSSFLILKRIYCTTTDPRGCLANSLDPRVAALFLAFDNTPPREEISSCEATKWLLFSSELYVVNLYFCIRLQESSGAWRNILNSRRTAAILL